jgi:hypothetical protein
MAAAALRGGWLMHTVTTTKQLHQRLGNCLRGSRRLRIWLELETQITLALAGFLALLITDAMFALPGWMRALVLLAGGSFGGLALWNAWRKFRSSPSPAVMLSSEEVRWLPVPLDVLRSGLEFATANSRAFGSPRLQEAMVAKVAEQLHWQAVWPYVRVRGVRRLVRISVLVFFLIGIGLSHPGTFPVALRRLVLPLAYHPWNAVHRDSPAFGAKGRPYPLRVTVTGWPVQQIHMEWDDGDERQEMLVPVEWSSDGIGRAEAELPVRGAFKYSLRARDFHADGTVRIADPPVLPPDTPSVEIQPPAYSGLPVQILSQPGTMEALHGSFIRLHGQAPATIHRLWFALEKKGERSQPRWDAELLLQPGTGAFDFTLETRVLTPGEWHCSLHIENAEGLRTTYRYGLLLIADTPPSVILHSTASNGPLQVPPDGSIPVHVVAEDKYCGLECIHLFITRQNGPADPGHAARLQWLGHELRRMPDHPLPPATDVSLGGVLHFDVAASWQRSLLCGCLSPDVLPVLPLTMWRMRPVRWELTVQLPARIIEAMGSGPSQLEAAAVDNSNQLTGVAWSQPLTVQVLSEKLWRQQRTAQLRQWLDRLHALQTYSNSLLGHERLSLEGDARHEVLAAQQDWQRQVEVLSLGFAQQVPVLVSARQRRDVLETCLFWRLSQVHQGLDRLAHDPGVSLLHAGLVPRPEQLRRNCHEAVRELRRLEQLLSEAWLREQAFMVLPEIVGHLQQVQASLIADGVSADAADSAWPAITQRLQSAQENWTLLWQQGRSIAPAWPDAPAARRIWAAWHDLHQGMYPPHRAKVLQACALLEVELHELRVDFLRRERLWLQQEIQAGGVAISWLRRMPTANGWSGVPVLRLARFLVPSSQDQATGWLEQALSIWYETRDSRRVAFCVETALLSLQRETARQEELCNRLQQAVLQERTQHLDKELERIVRQWAASMRTLPEERLTPAAAWALRARQQQWSQGVERVFSEGRDHPILAASLHRLQEQSQDMEAAWTGSMDAGRDVQELRLAWEQWRTLLAKDDERDDLLAPHLPNNSKYLNAPAQAMTWSPLRLTPGDATPRSMLSPRMRRALEQHAQERFPPHYAEECARYYRTLLEMHRPREK